LEWIVRILVQQHVGLFAEEVRQAPVFQDWERRLGPGWQGVVTVNEAGVWGGQVHMLQLSVAPVGDPWPSQITLRSETVDVLVIYTDGRDAGWVVLLRQYRPATGSVVYSNAAGGKEWDETPEAAARRELIEELGLEEGEIDEFVITLMVPKPVLATPGLTNERVYMFRAVRTVPVGRLEDAIDRLIDRRTGVKSEGEELTLRPIPAAHARRFLLHDPETGGDVDGKTLLSLSLAGL
jgi:8-oxo-dGTP pyrophosphatase MutT (NUDIX family)